jgi:hypothetical protein
MPQRRFGEANGSAGRARLSLCAGENRGPAFHEVEQAFKGETPIRGLLP